MTKEIDELVAFLSDAGPMLVGELKVDLRAIGGAETVGSRADIAEQLGMSIHAAIRAAHSLARWEGVHGPMLDWRRDVQFIIANALVCGHRSGNYEISVADAKARLLVALALGNAAHGDLSEDRDAIVLEEFISENEAAC